jgi:hypothetical protein
MSLSARSRGCRSAASHPVTHNPIVQAGTAARPLFTACLLALCICTTGARSASAGTPYVDGISDQSLPHWNGAGDEEASFKSSYFANLFYTSWIGGGSASHIKLARYAVRWNVMSDPSGEPYRTFASWYRDAGHVLGLTLDVAIYNPEGPLPSAAEYRTQVEKLLHAFPVPYVEAWNEPNDEGVTPVAAAFRERATTSGSPRPEPMSARWSARPERTAQPAFAGGAVPCGDRHVSLSGHTSTA